MIQATINKTRLMAIFLLLVLAGCGQGNVGGGEATPIGDNTTLQSQPVAVVLRPGESETVETTAVDSFTGDPVGFDFGTLTITELLARYLNIGPSEACPDSDFDVGCEWRTVDAGLSADDHEYDHYAASGFRGSTPLKVPVNLFLASPAAAPPVVELAAGEAHSLALTADGSVWAWGSNDRGQLGDGSRRDRSQPARIANLSNIVAIAGGTSHSVAVDSDGAVWAWGRNIDGILGDGTNTDRETPVQVSGLGNIVAVAAGDDMSYALRSDGQVFGWGVLTTLWVREREGESVYPDNGFVPVAIPTADGFLDGIRAIAAGGGRNVGGGFLALDDSNQVWEAYQPEDLVTEGYSMEVKDGLPDIREIAAGGAESIGARSFYLALDGENRVWSWGDNDSNQLGRVTDIANDRDPEPAVIPGLRNVSRIAAGGAFGMAAVVGDPVTGDPEGSVWIWGDVGLGQGGGLGIAGVVQEPAPIQALSTPLINNDFDGVRQIAAGASHAMAVSVGRHINACQEAGTGRDLGSRVYAWGDNLSGQRGDGTGINALGATPVLTLGDDNSCVNDIGHRLIVYKQGLGSGEVTSDVSGTDPTTDIDQTLYCRGIMCWQNLPAGTTVTLTATPDENSSVSESQWQWDCTGFPGLLTTSVQVNGPTHCKIRFGRGEPEEPGEPPTELLASFTVTPNPATVDANIVFDAADSTGDIASHQWDFEDDGSFDASGQSVSHSYPAAGSYLARLRITDNAGNTSETTESVNVTDTATETALLTVQVLINGGPGGTVRGADGGILCGTNGNDCDEEIPLGMAVLLTPIPEPGTTGIGWSGCDEDQGEEGCFIQSMDGPRTVTATFSVSPP